MFTDFRNEYTADVYPNSSCGFGLIGFSFGMGRHDMHITCDVLSRDAVISC